MDLFRNKLNAFLFALIGVGTFLSAQAANCEPSLLSSRGHTILFRGQPILLFGDTIWPAPVQMTDASMMAYLRNAKATGFNTVAVFATGDWMMADGRTNRNGDAPFIKNEPELLNQPYWERYRTFFRLAANQNLLVYFCVGDSLAVDGGLASPWPIHSDEQAYRYGLALGAFFRHENPNLIWSLGQDSAPPATGNRDRRVVLSQVDAAAHGIADGVNGLAHMSQVPDFTTTFMTFHIAAGYTTTDYFAAKPWLDMNGFQTWKYYTKTAALSARQYAQVPTLPGIDHEPAYEGDESHKDGEPKTAWHIRAQTYWSLFTGSVGIIHGFPGIWDVTDASTPAFRDALKVDGRQQIRYAKRLMERVPFYRLLPDQTLLASDPGDLGSRTLIVAARDSDDQFAFVYVPDGREFRLDLRRFGAAPRMTWVDPRTGREQTARAVRQNLFSPPSASYPNNDWILRIEAQKQKVALVKGGTKGASVAD